jgi:hypothetical protein
VDFEGPALERAGCHAHRGLSLAQGFGGFNPNGCDRMDEHGRLVYADLGLKPHTPADALDLLLTRAGPILRHHEADGSIIECLPLFVQKGGEWVKLRKIGGGEAAIFDYARSGRQQYRRGR